MAEGLPDEARWARYFGYDVPPALPREEYRPPVPTLKAAPGDVEQLPPSEPESGATAVGPAHAEFYYVSRYEHFEDETPEVRRRTLEDADINRSGAFPLPPDLAPRARLWPYIRAALTRVIASGELDQAAVVRALAALATLSRTPWRMRRGWAPRVMVISDDSRRLGAFKTDRNRLLQRIGRDLGPASLISRSVSEARPLRESFSEFLNSLPAGAPVIALGDLGCLNRDEGIERQWYDFGKSLVAGGHRITALATCPTSRWHPGLAALWRMTLWDRGSRPQPYRVAHDGNDPVGPLDRRYRPRLPAAGDELASEAHQAMFLLRLLSPAVFIEDATLRSLRYALGSAFGDVGTEADVWDHPLVETGVLGFAVKTTALKDLFDGFAEAEKKVPFSMAGFLQKHHAHLAPLARAEESMGLARLGAKDAQECYQNALEVYRKLLEYLCSGDDRLGAMAQLRQWFREYHPRAAPGVWESPELSALWLLTAPKQVSASGELPAGFNDRALSLVKGPSAEQRRLILGQQGTRLVISSASAAPRSDIQPWQPTYSPLGEIGAFDGEATIQMHAGEGRPANGQTRIRIGSESGGEGRFPVQSISRIVSAFASVEIDRAEKPSWASMIMRDKEGLLLEVIENGTPRMMRWFNPGRYEAVQGGLETDGISPRFDVKHGFWWDAREHVEWLEHGFRKPAWASNFGTDQYGMYAEFTIESATQRMRWIPPGRFMMGSPEEEKERHDDESQHEVVLTHGFWLADTACTQEMWQAVMGENPSEFRDDPRNPVEKVSWETIRSGFLPRINGAIPGIGLCLPTEAQWEFACRAGTTTPFWWGDELTTDDANYDGNHPYAGGSKGEDRQKTVQVKTFKPNPWGLWQMHGNVWEWCADWVGAYPRGPVIDPRGPDAGSTRVLRGGCWINYGRSLRSAYRDRNDPSNRDVISGFRLARGHGELRQVQPEREAERSEASEVPPARRTGGGDRSRSAAAGGRNIFDKIGRLIRPDRTDR